MGHIKLKNTKKKKKKYILFLLLIYISFSYTFYNTFKNNSMNQEFIQYILENGTPYIERKYKLPKILNKTMNYFLKIDFTKPYSLFNQSIIGNNIDDELTDEDFNKLKQISYYMEDANKNNISNPLIYIYNTHQLENYNSDNLNIYGITPNVLMISYLLKDKLNQKGIPTLVEDTNISEFLSINNWDYSNSYNASRVFLLDKINMYNSLKYYIDIHRDSVSKNISTININNKNYARVLFVLGLENKNYNQNLEVMTNINNILNKKYPGLSRGIYKKEGPNVNGIYNQDINKNVILLELGGIDNTMDELLNTINVLTEVLSIYIEEYEK